MCTPALHDAIKADPSRFRAELHVIGVLADAEAPLVLGNCPSCLTTLAAPATSAEVERAASRRRGAR